MEQLETHDIYTDDVIPSASINPKKLGSLWVDYKKNKLYICSSNSNNKNVWSIANPDIVIPEPLKYRLKMDVKSAYHRGPVKAYGVSIVPNTNYINSPDSGELWLIYENNSYYRSSGIVTFNHSYKGGFRHEYDIEAEFGGTSIVIPGYGFYVIGGYDQGLIWVSIKLEQIK